MPDTQRVDPNPRITEPGIYDDLTNAEYHAHPSVSSSQLVDACRSMAHFWANSPLNHEYMPKEPTDAMVRGTAVHTYLLEPDTFDARYLVAPEKAAHKDVLDNIEQLQAFLTENGVEYKSSMKKPALLELARPLAAEQGRIVWADVEADFKAKLAKAGCTQVTAENRRDYQRMGEQLAKQELKLQDSQGNPLLFRLADLFAVGKAELSVFWKDPKTKLMCRVRPDWLVITPSMKLIIDYKTTRNADQFPFQHQAQELMYWMKAAMYKEGVRLALLAMRRAGTLPPDWAAALGTGRMPDFDYILLAQEHELPYLAATYHYPDQFIEYGRELYRAKLEKVSECRAKRVWPGYTNELRPIQVRDYAYTRYPELEPLIETGVSQYPDETEQEQA